MIEDELRDVLVTRASDVPANAIARLAGADYRPRTYLVRPPVAAGALAGAAGAAALASLIGLSTGASNAFAGWSPTPTAAPAAQAADAEARCATSLTPPPHAPKAVGPLRPVLTDVRGPFTVIMFAGVNTNATCISGPDFTTVSGSHSTLVAPLDSNRIQLSGVHFTTRDGQPYTLIDGRAGKDVSSITLVRDDGTQVKATTANGWFAAWWPGTHTATDAKLATPSGVTDERLNTGGPEMDGSRRLTGGGGTSSKAGSVSGSGTASTSG